MAVAIILWLGICDLSGSSLHSLFLFYSSSYSFFSLNSLFCLLCCMWWQSIMPLSNAGSVQLAKLCKLVILCHCCAHGPLNITEIKSKTITTLAFTIEVEMVKNTTVKVIVSRACLKEYTNIIVIKGKIENNKYRIKIQ